MKLGQREWKTGGNEGGSSRKGGHVLGQFLLLPWGASYTGGVCWGLSISSEEECQTDGAEQLDDRRKKVKTLVCPRQNCCKHKDKHYYTLYTTTSLLLSICQFILTEQRKRNMKEQVCYTLHLLHEHHGSRKNSLKRTYENYCSARLEKHTPKIGQSISKSLLIGIFVGHNCWCVSGQHFTQLNIYTIECNNSTKAHFSETKIQDFFRYIYNIIICIIIITTILWLHITSSWY